MRFRALRYGLFVAVSFLLCSCKQEQQEPPVRIIGQAFAGPNELPLRQDISLRSPVITKVQHGEKLEIIERRRRFVQVRTPKKAIGWVDMRLLISDKQMAMLEAMAKQYANAPSMGRATVFDILNVHTDPNRYSPTFIQIQEKEHVEIVGHRVVPKVPFHGETLDIEDDTVRKPPVKKQRPKKDAKIPLPPPPPAPKLPDNWRELSQLPEEGKEAKLPSSADAKNQTPVVLDDMSLVRTPDGRVGWVLTNALFLEVPDEVAQYAEGHKITSYFELGTVTDGDAKHHHYLWTTQSQKLAPFEYDSLRLFTWNTRRHRYETSYRERNLRGHYPTVIDRSKANLEFHTVIEDDEGKLWQRSYAFNGTRVQFLGKKPYQAPPEQVITEVKPTSTTDENPSWWQKLKKLAGRK